MVVSDASIHNIMGGMESTAGVRLHNHRRKLKQRFDIIKKLGQGTYGKVQLGINKETGQEVAIKTIKKAKIETEADLVRIRREIQIMSSVQHPNIIHIYEVFENREKMVLVMEYAAGGELYDFLSERKVLAEEEARRIFRQIATAVYYCHKHKICHRDLKLENILLDEHGSAKIADFGLSNVFDEQRLLNTFCGSPLYASPEIVKGTPYHGPEVDCWSLGVLLYTLVYGAMPFDGSNFKRLVKQISQGDYFEPKKPSPASPLIREMLTVTPSRRADIEKICSHWWVNEGHADSCLDIAEELANQTPVRLDLLLSLAPPPPAVGSDKILLTDEQGQCDSRAIVTDQLCPPRCHSVGSLMELDQSSAERRIREFELEKRRGSGGDIKDAPKRKLEEGVSTEDAAHGGAKRKECVGRREYSVNHEQSVVRANSLNRQVSTEQDKRSMSAAEEEMDVDMDVGIPEPVNSKISKETAEPTAVNGEALKNETPIDLDSAGSCKADTSTQKDPTKTTIAGDRTTRKSVKSFTKKSKPSTDSVPSNIETKGMEPEPEVKQTEEERSSGKTNAEETPMATQGLSSECNKPKEGTDEPPVEAVKPKVKKKKVVNNSKSENTSIENVQNITGEVGAPETSLKPADTKSNLDGSSSQKMKGVIVKTEIGDKANKRSDVSDKVLKKSLSSSKDSSDSKMCDVPKTAHVKTKKSCGDLTLGKLGSSTDKSSGAEELASPTKHVERRRSKIFENADKFNIFLSGSDPKSPTTEKPKKVFIPGVKVSDYKQAFERRSSLSSTSLPVPVKNSSSKKAVEQNSKNIPTKSSSSDSGNVDTPKTLKDVERSSNVPELIPEFGLNEAKQSEDSLGLKQVETLPESSKHNQSSIDSSVPQNNEINSEDQSTKLTREGSNEGENMNSQKIMTSDSVKDEEADLKLVPALQVTDKVSQQEKARIKKLKDAVEIINNAIAEESRRELDLNAVKKVTSAKPPVPSSTDKPKAKSTASSDSSSKSPPLSPTDVPSGKRTIRVQVAPNDVRLATVQVSTPQNTTFVFDNTSVAKPLADKGSETKSEIQNASDPSQNKDSSNEHKEGDTPEPRDVERNLDTVVPAKKKSAKVEIILKSATLPRRRTSKAEIQLGFPPNSRPESEAPGEYRTEVEQMVGSTTPRLQTQRSEVAFPVAAATNVKPFSFRSSSLEPEGTPSSKNKPREHVIPIRVEQDADESSTVSSPLPAKPSIQRQRSVSHRSNSLSRQSTQDSDTDSTISVTGPEPIRKSPREYIIPIAVEGGGYIAPRAGSLEPSISEASTEASRLHHRSPVCFSKPRRMSSLLSDGGASEDEGFNSLGSPFATLQKHSSFGKDDPDDERPFHRMHRLRSSRPSRRPPLEHNDSLSSAEEDEDDDDGFEILTAESLFSTLLSRVRSLTQRLNVEDTGHPGFPSSRLLSHLAASRRSSPSGFWSNMYGQQGEPLSRRISESSHFSRPFGNDGGGPSSWRRNISRHVSDGDSVYSETGGGTLPRGPSRLDSGSISDDAGSELNSSYYYTPSMARRIQHNWHSSCQDVGSQSTMNQQTPPSDHHIPTRKLSLGSLTSQDSNIPQHTSRRLSTLSLQNAAVERSNSCISRNQDYCSRSSNLLNSKFGVQGGKDSHDNLTLSLHRQDYLSDMDESTRNQTRKDYLTSGRRSLSLLDSKDRDFFSISTHRDSSASDCDVYGHHRKPLGINKVLPPLPCSAGSHGRRREVGQSSSSTRQHSTDVAGGPYENHLNGSGHNLNHSTIPEETAYDRSHHSSSLPSVTRTKEKKHFYSCADKMNTELKTSSNCKVDSSCNASVNPEGISSYSALPSQLNISTFDGMGTSSSVLESMPDVRSKHQARPLRKSNSNATSSSEYKGRSQIPSLLHFRSPTVSCEVEKQRKVHVEEGTDSASKPQSTSISRRTPDRSVLSKFFRQGSVEKDRRQQVQPAGEEKDAAKKKRRISRFLRPDFFDTPREESIYAKEKDACKAKEENKLKLRKNIQRLAAEKNGSVSQIHAGIETGASSGHSEERLETNLVPAFSDSINADKDNMNLKNSKSETKQMDKKSGEQMKSVNEVAEKSDSMIDAKKTEKSCLKFEKLSNNVSRKSQFLHSLEKKLEKFRSSGDYIPSASTSGESRVDKAICSLRKQSLAPRSGDIVTSESHLLKRAVSVSDCYTVESSSKNYLPSMNENARSKLRNKVTSVLGLFRNLEGTPVKTCQSSPVQPSLLSRLRRTQSVYAGSHNDNVLLEPDTDVSGSREFKTFPPQCLKKISSNSSVVKKKSIERDVKIQMGNLETNKSTETHLQNPGLNTLEHKTINHSTELTTENMLDSETVFFNSNTTKEMCVSEGSIATKQQESSVPKLLKRGSIKSKTKNVTEGSSQAQSNNDISADSDTKITSVLEHGKCLEEEINMRSVIQGNTKPDRPNSLTGLKETIAYKGMKVPKAADTPVVKLEVTTSTNDDVSLETKEVASDARAMYIPGKVEKSINHLGRNKNNCVRRESSGHMSCKVRTDAGTANEQESCTISGLSPTTDAALDNSLADEYSLNEDEIKFANAKHCNLCLVPADDSFVLSTPHELESSDSRSVCSDFENFEFPQSPVSPPGDDIEESVGDRIRRKSFYSRFNDVKKKPRKSSLSSVGSFPFSYQDPNCVPLLYHPRNFLRKKGRSVDYVTNTCHSVHLPLKSHRSQSLYAQNDYDDGLASYTRRSPIPYRSQHSSYTEGYLNSLRAENMTNEMSEYVDDFSLTDKNDLWDGSQKASVPLDKAVQTALSVGESVPVLGGSTETLRMPRHFQHVVNHDTLPYQPLYSDTMIRGSDSHLSRSTESCIGTAIPKSHLPTIRDRHLSLAPGLASKNNCVAVTSPDNAVQLGSVAGETLPLHGECNRFNSKSPSSVCNGPPKAAGQNHWMESELSVTPH